MIDNAQLAVAAAVFLVTAGSVYARRSTSNAGRKLPPGPPGIPILGNVLQVPTKHLATYFRGVLEEYGGLVSLNLAGFPVILIGDIKVAKEILEKHSAKHSSRPVVPYVRHHIDPTKAYWGVCEQGETHTIGRKLTAGLMSTVRAGKTEPLQEFEAVLNIQNLLDDGGKDWFHHMDRYVAQRDPGETPSSSSFNSVAASTVLAAGFGMHCPTGHEADLKEIIKAIADFVQLCTPSASIINVLPFLDYIPGPMPWRTRAQAYREREDAIYKKLIDEAVTGKGSGMNTWAAAFAREDKPEGDQRRLMNQFTGTALSLQTFVLACIRYPEWISTAQKEIDAVVGPDRLPSFKDRPFLPYVEAIVRETLRWRPAARFGVPHQSTASDVIEYEGKEYFIPEGSIIFAVPWAIEHDQSRFEDHDRFMPERFLDAEGNLKPDYDTSAFGFGRRMCPGIPFAERSLWIDIATMLWTFNIRGSDKPDPATGLPFHYDDSDAAFSGDETIMFRRRYLLPPGPLKRTSRMPGGRFSIGLGLAAAGFLAYSKRAIYADTLDPEEENLGVSHLVDGMSEHDPDGWWTGIIQVTSASSPDETVIAHSSRLANAHPDFGSACIKALSELVHRALAIIIARRCLSHAEHHEQHVDLGSIEAADASTRSLEDQLHRDIRDGCLAIDDLAVSYPLQKLQQLELPHKMANITPLLDVPLSGFSTAMVSHDPDKRMLRVANIGSTRVVLGRRAGTTKTGQQAYSVYVLSDDHTCDTAPGLTRAFGLAAYKWSLDVQKKLHKDYLGDPPISPPSRQLTADPSTRSIKLEPGDFVVMASDGLWKSITNEEVVGLVGMWLNRNMGASSSKAQSGAPDEVIMPQELPIASANYKPIPWKQWGVEKAFIYTDNSAAKHLTRNALGGAHADLRTALMHVQAPRAAKFRDDILLSVIFFDRL
ncbi:hypothetical protein DXG01_014705 [Tephrocybe rancida]|nr:hypothetical protein DXG01_014705 [Tephrocybe rancida]